MNFWTKKDIFFMQQAIKCAKKAYLEGEVAIGAVIIKDNKIIANGYNKSITLKDTTSHAEIVAIRKACKKLSNYRLNDCSMYVTVEPCMMCLGALIHARIKNLYFGTNDIKTGACNSILDISKIKTNHKINIYSGLLQDDCAKIIRNFFETKRRKK